MATASLTTPPTAEPSPQPSGTTARITNLDFVRGVALLGILVMNAVSYGLGTTAYFNLDAAGSNTTLDWLIGGFGEIFVDQKFMGLFSMLFGAGIVLFADRAAAKGANSGRLSLWRNGLLLLIGFVHGLAWEGDVLVVYALAAPVLILVRNRRPAMLAVAGVAAVLSSAVTAALVQTTIDASGLGLGEYWLGEGPLSDGVGSFLLIDFFGRAVGMMLIGVALYRSGFLTGDASTATYRRVAVSGLVVGLGLAAAGLALVAAGDFGPDVALVGSIPNTIGTIPAAIGYLALLSLWHARGSGRIGARLQAVGRMALTNYLSQTALGLLAFGPLWNLLTEAAPSRTAIAGFILAVWALQLWWSSAWLARYRYGPAEWLWRCATYRRLQPLKR